MNRLKELREERGWNMREAAKFLKQPYTTYVNHEKGVRGLDDTLLKKYASAYNVSVDYLVGRTEIKTPITTTGEGLNLEDLKLIVDQLTPENVEILKGQAQVLLAHQKVQDGQ